MSLFRSYGRELRFTALANQTDLATNKGMDHPLQKTLPEDMQAARALPGVQPVTGEWLCVDDAYAGQMACREQLLDTRRADVLQMLPEAQAPAVELLEDVHERAQSLGFAGQDQVTCPDGRVVTMERDDPLGSLGRLVQCDFCLLDKVGSEHVLKGAVLCFPASWQLSEKFGRPLGTIHDPVDEYDASVAARVQRLFDGVQLGRPLWRFNQLWYDDPTLHQPRSAIEPRRVHGGPSQAGFYRSERQTIFRLPKSGWVVFAIHTLVLAAEDVPFLGQSSD